MVNSGPLPTLNMEFFGMKVNSIAKSSNLDGPGVFQLYNSYHPFLVTVQIYFTGDRKFLILELFVLFLTRKKAHGNGKTNQI